MRRRWLGAIIAALGVAAITPGLASANDQAGTWTSLGHVDETVGAAWAPLPDGRIFFAGGSQGRPPAMRGLTIASIFDPRTRSLATIARMREARGAPLVIPLTSGAVLVAGGQDQSRRLNSAEIYDQATNSWSDFGAIPGATRFDADITLPDGRVFLCAGNAILFDPATRIWRDLGALNAIAPIPALLHDGRVIVVGGQDPTTFASVPATEIFNLSVGTRIAGPDMSQATSGPSVVPLKDGSLVAFGGIDWAAGSNPGVAGPGTPLATVQLLTPNAGQWTQLAGPAPPQSFGGGWAAPLSDGRVAAGHPKGASTLTSIFDPQRRSWSPAATAPTALPQPRSGPDDELISISADGDIYTFEPPPAAGTVRLRSVSGARNLAPFALALAFGLFVATLLAARRPRAWRWLRAPITGMFQFAGLLGLTWVLVQLAGLAPPATTAADAYAFPARELALLAQPVPEVVAITASRSLLLLTLAAAWATCIGVGAGLMVVSAGRRMLGSLSIAATGLWVLPTFLLAVLVQELQAAIYGHSGLVVAAGFGEISSIQVFWAAVVLGIRPAAYLYQHSKAVLEDELADDYARTALAKGLSFRKTVFRHVFAAGSAELVSPWVNAVRLMVGALPLVEFFFGYPGLGRILVLALGINYNGEQGAIHVGLAVSLMVVMGAVLILSETISQLGRTVLDPRLRRAAA